MLPLCHYDRTSFLVNCPFKKISSSCKSMWCDTFLDVITGISGPETFALCALSKHVYPYCSALMLTNTLLITPYTVYGLDDFRLVTYSVTYKQNLKRRLECLQSACEVFEVRLTHENCDLCHSCSIQFVTYTLLPT